MISVIGLVGVMIGALAAGTVSDLIGRRKAMLWTTISFSVLTLLCAFATESVSSVCCVSWPASASAGCSRRRWR